MIRETVTQALTKLQKKGLIEQNYDFNLILDTSTLEKIIV
ncbi:helix-turn-helix domain-containing protein [Mastigocoleus testarum]